MIDYYEFLQISPHADSETIHRVYRYLAGRLHPDNPQSGDPEMFRLLKSAYDVLSNSATRAEYDATRNRNGAPAVPMSSSVDFMDNLDGELNRRLAVLAVLYFRRRSNPGSPEVSLSEIEKQMGFPRDYLDFTTWYLVKKGYITRADNSDFTLTADGVDFVEAQRTTLPVLNRLLTDGNGFPAAGTAAHNGNGGHNGNGHHSAPIILPATIHGSTDRRVNKRDRRSNPGGRRASDRILPS
jgi:curved DNA-binding protein CbpA